MRAVEAASQERWAFQSTENENNRIHGTGHDRGEGVPVRGQPLTTRLARTRLQAITVGGGLTGTAQKVLLVRF